MLVKIQTFRKDSHHPTAAARSEYLIGDSRAVGGITTQNIVDDARAFREIDETRERSGARGSVTGRELVLSPSPQDNATPGQVREFAHELLAKEFPNFEAVVVVHDDNAARIATGERGIPHAHVYLGVIDLETGRKLNLSKEKVRSVHDRAQDMSRERGWSFQPSYEEAAKREKRLARDRQAHFANGEHDSAKRGRPFVKDAIRDALNRAVRDMNSNPALRFGDALRAHGVEAREAVRGGYKYRMAGGGNGQFYGARSLGREYSLEGIKARVGPVRPERSPERRSPRGEQGYERGR